MIRLIIHGCNGKMGRVLTEMVKAQEEFRVAAGVDVAPQSAKNDYPVYASLAECREEADVVVDFSVPEAVPALLESAAARKLPVIIATTGLAEAQWKLIRAQANRIPIFHAANMSLGINLVAELIQKAAAVLADRYDIEIVERHHNLKKDAPSGTAYFLADCINQALPAPKEYVFGRHTRSEARKAHEIGIHAVRGGTIVGEHSVLFAGKDETLEINHASYSKQVFAAGALKAARYIVKKGPGLYRMKDMITEDSAVTSLFASDEEALVTVHHVPHDSHVLAQMFKILGEGKVVIDMISQTAPANGTVDLSFTLPRQSLARAVDLIHRFRESHTALRVDVLENITKVSVEGQGMETQSGVAARVFDLMAGLGVNIKTVTTSETKISYIIDQKDGPQAVAAIKRSFGI